jgi:hypothetical protein
MCLTDYYKFKPKPTRMTEPTEPTEPIKLCKDCAYFYSNCGNYCNRPSDKIDYVNGGYIRLNKNAQDQRVYGDAPNTCGKNAKYFKAKELNETN